MGCHILTLQKNFRARTQHTLGMRAEVLDSSSPGSKGPNPDSHLDVFIVLIPKSNSWGEAVTQIRGLSRKTWTGFSITYTAEVL